MEFDEFLTVFLACIGTIFAAYIFYMAVERRINAPRFAVGIVPNEREIALNNSLLGSLLETSLLYEVKLHGRYLAKQVKAITFVLWLHYIAKQTRIELPVIWIYNKITRGKVNSDTLWKQHQSFQEIKRLHKIEQDTLRCRHIEVADNRIIDLPIIIQNEGRKLAERYYLRVLFSESCIQLVSVDTESLALEGLYTDQPEKFETQRWKRFLPVSFIIKAYQTLDLPGSTVCLVGNLESNNFEMVYLRVMIPMTINTFFVIFRVDSIQITQQTRFYVQPVRVAKVNQH